MLTTSSFYQTADELFLWYFTVINSVYLILLICGSVKIFRRKREVFLEDFTNILRSNSLPEITFIVPALNEAANIQKNIQNLADLTYLYKQVIIINDGSKDNTLQVLKKELKLAPIPKYYEDKLPTAKIKQVYISERHPEFIVIDKENGGGKFDALNAGINASQNPYFVAVDADTIIDDKAFLSLVRPLLTDPTLVAVGASVKIRNGCELGYNQISTETFPQNILPAFQSLEYMRAFLERQGWDYIGGNFVLAGAFSMFKRDEVIEVGGYVNTVAEDMEIIIRLHRVLKAKKRPYRIMYLPDSVAWTEAPETLKKLGKQRAKWHSGLLDSLWFHRSTGLQMKTGGIFAYFVYPFWLHCEALEPIVEGVGILYIILGYLGGYVHIHFILLFLIVTWGFTLLFTTLCIMIEQFSFNRYPSLRTLCYFFLYNMIENFGYRQANILWRLKGFIRFYQNRRTVRSVSKQVKSLLRKATKGLVS